MGYSYPEHGRAAPFVPASMTLPKKKAKALKSYFNDVPLSLAQKAIAKALGWTDWFALEQAVKAQQPPSLPDEDVPEQERLRRWSTQFNALHEVLNLALPTPEFLTAELGLTCSAATAKQRREEVGPWGAFQETPEEIATGIWQGQCAKFMCYRLSEERQLEMPPQWRLDTEGWYMRDDHGWRVELAFPDVFDAKARMRAIQAMAEVQPFLYELEFDKPPLRNSVLIPTLAARTSIARQRPDEWFALAVFPDWTLANGKCPNDRTIVSAVRGRDLLRLIDLKGVWPGSDAIEVGWYATTIGDLRERCRISLPGLAPHNAQATCLTGLPAYAHAPVCALPYKQHPFDALELDFSACAGYEPLVTEIADGLPVPLR